MSARSFPLAAIASAWPALLLAGGLGALLGAFAGVDPASGVTISGSPFTDEGWNVVNARNLVLLGSWSTDDWNLHLVNTPFSVLTAAIFQLFGVGIVQARVLPIAATSLTVFLLGAGLAGAVGRWAAVLGAIALGSSALVLYYGRLAYLEPVVTVFLVAGLLSAAHLGERRPGLVGLGSGLLLAAAIGTKPSAAFAVAGILAGVLLADAGSRSGRRWALGVAGGVAAAFLAWLLVIALPNLGAVFTDLRIWAPQQLPRSIGELVQRVTSYPQSSDGATLLSLPLLAAGIIGGGYASACWGRLSAAQRRLLLGAAGWLLIGLLPLLILPYRPNRYVVPLLPPLAIAMAIGAGALAQRGAWPSTGQRVAAVGIGAVLAVPGLALHAGWMAATPSRLPAIQAQVASTIPGGARVQGAEAPILAMTSRAVLVVSRPADGVNAGDGYAAGARWIVGGPDDPLDVPGWATLHPEAWAARHEVACWEWGGESLCLWQLPGPMGDRDAQNASR